MINLTFLSTIISQQLTGLLTPRTPRTQRTGKRRTGWGAHSRPRVSCLAPRPQTLRASVAGGPRRASLLINPAAAGSGDGRTITMNWPRSCPGAKSTDFADRHRWLRRTASASESHSRTTSARTNQTLAAADASVSYMPQKRTIRPSRTVKM
jgi:hypothetical protein